MPRTPNWRRYLRFWGANVDADIDDELRFHLEMREADYRARGYADAEARDAARLRFGDLDDVTTRLRIHDRRKAKRQRREDMFDDLIQDVRYGFRTLRRNWGLTLAIVSVLALGVGANSAMFSVVDAVLLRPLPFREPDRLVFVGSATVPFDTPGPQRQARVTDIAAERSLFSGAAAYGVGGGNISGGSEPVRARVAMATPSLFPLLGIRPALGRTFTEEEGRASGPLVTVISYGLWQRNFGGDPAVLGRSLVLNGRSYEIVGVMQNGVAFPGDAELWTAMPVPLPFDRADIFRTVLTTNVVARLAPGATVEQASAMVKALNDRLRAPGMSAPPDRKDVVPMRDLLVGRKSKAPLMILLGAVGFVLLVACANVSNLLLTRAASRQREIAVRAALGASRWRIARQLLTESLLLALAGAAAGVVVAAIGSKLFAALAPASMVSVAPVRIDWRVLSFTLVAAIVTGIVFGTAPAVAAARADVQEPLKTGSGAGASTKGRRLRSALVVAEIALALVLVTGAGLMLRSFVRLLDTDVGFRTEKVAMAKITLPRSRFASAEQRQRLYDAVLARLEADPAIASSGVITAAPLSTEGAVGFSFKVDGAEKEPTEAEAMSSGLAFSSVLSVSPGYFSTLGIQVQRGRGFLPSDKSATHVAVVNERFASTFWPTTGAIGKRVYPYRDTVAYTIVGVVSDVRAFNVTEKPGLVIYRPLEAFPPDYATIVARGDLAMPVLMARIRDAVWSYDRQQAVFEMKPLESVISDKLAPQRTATLLITLFGVLALTLAAVGVYAVIAFGVAQRTREIGIRMALGASARAVIDLVLRDGLKLAGVGTAFGLAGAFALTRLMSSLLYEVSTLDTFTFVAAPLMLIMVSALAVYLPARRALRVDPATALRSD